MLEFGWRRLEIKDVMYCVKQKNRISLAERASHNRFCDRNLLKTGSKYFLQTNPSAPPNQAAREAKRKHTISREVL
jgi:hypothetical protein